jgi:hypothetical protein
MVAPGTRWSGCSLKRFGSDANSVEMNPKTARPFRVFSRLAKLQASMSVLRRRRSWS